MTDVQVINVGAAETGYLTAASSEQQLRTYFNGLLEIARTQKNDFPVNLEDVWRLVYAEKGKAVRALKRYFIEGVDFSSFAQNGKREKGGTVIHNYFLSLSCLEFFVARKVRAVFEVYRQVFHKAVRYALPEETEKLDTNPPKDASVSEVLQWIEGLQKYAGIGQSSTLELMERIAQERNLPMPDYIEAEPERIGLFSLTNCLEYWKVKCSAHLFNRALMEIGYITEKNYKEGKRMNSYKVIVGDGLFYGENRIPIKYPNITQPLWYIERFGKLLEVVRETGLFSSSKK